MKVGEGIRNALGIIKFQIKVKWKKFKNEICQTNIHLCYNASQYIFYGFKSKNLKGQFTFNVSK